MNLYRIQSHTKNSCSQSDNNLQRAPSHLSFEELAAIPLAGATAVNALFFGPVPLTKGMTVLTEGTGGVSCFVIQVYLSNLPLLSIHYLTLPVIPTESHNGTLS